MSKERDCMYGIKYFTDHSDCDGEFYNEACKYIAEALNTYMNNPNNYKDNEPELTKLMEELKKTFEYASEHECIVHIF